MVVVIGISGPTTSGKSTIAEEIKKMFNCKIICVDGYFKVNPEMPKIEINGLTIIDFDNRDAIEWNYLIEDIEKEKNQSNDFLIVEGFLLFGDPQLYDIIDVLITVNFDIESDQQLALKRRLNRFKWNELIYANQGKEDRKIYEEEEEIPEDYETNPEKNRINYLTFYFNHVAWPHVKGNQEFVRPLNWKKPILELSATDDIHVNVQKSIEFINKNKEKSCRI